MGSPDDLYKRTVPAGAIWRVAEWRVLYPVLMHCSLAWIEWLDRLDRVLQSARADLAVYCRSGSPRRLATLQTAHRQLEALLEQLQWMDPTVLVGETPAQANDIVNRLRVVVGTVMLRISRLSGEELPGQLEERQSALRTLDTALWDGRYEAAHLLEPHRQPA